MLSGIVRKPLTVTLNQTGAAAPSNTMNKKKDGSTVADADTDGAADSAKNKNGRRHHHHHHQSSPQSHHHHHEGKERIIPLTRRPIHNRLDVYPFVIGYLLLILCDTHMNNNPSNNDSIDSGAPSMSTNVVMIDIFYLLLLLTQLILFLKCQWDPMWHASIAYWRYNFKRSPSLNDGTAAAVMEQKIRDMQKWTHCLIVPPNPYDVSSSSTINGGKSKSNGDKGKGTAAAATSQTVRPERPGIVPLTLKVTTSNATDNDDDVTSFVAIIHFRGWAYRCCCNTIGSNDDDGILGDNVHADLPMESIWQTTDEKESSIDLEEIASDGVEEEEERSVDKDSYKGNATSSTTTSWEPNFHRLHFPIDLPLHYYSTHTGHTSPQTLQTTLQIYGSNTTNIPLPPYLSLLTQQLLQPMFLFQLLCVMLWSLDEYWMYAIFTLLSLLMFESLQAFNRWKSVKRLREEVVGADVTDDDENGQGNTNSVNKKAQTMVECYRMGEWTTVPTNRLVVGDVISLVSPSVHDKSQTNTRGGKVVRNVHDHERGCTIPADLLLLNGRAVVNEAMLTGESVPQVKESIEIEEGGGGQQSDGDDETSRLDLSDGSAHKKCVLFGGTTLMDHHSSFEEQDDGGDESGNNNNSIPSPPNHGLVCFVLRTGFDTIQGQLLRTLAYHAESGGGGNSGGGEGVNAKETFYFLLLLLLCALASAATVVQHAWGDVTRNHFKLILHVIIIITSVIPPELPMELSLAVTTSLGELIKQYQVYCTEPFRIPLAGLVDTCCFDKTGTLTSDELRLHGVRLPSLDMGDTIRTKNGVGRKDSVDEDLILFDDLLLNNEDRHEQQFAAKPSSAGIGDLKKEDSLGTIDTVNFLLPRETLRVMVGCQSLATTHVLVPGGRNGRTEVRTELCGDPLEKAVMEACGYTIDPRTDLVVESNRAPPSMMLSGKQRGGSMKVLHRFAFSSKLRRMTVLALDSSSSGDGNNNNSNATTTLWALTKGAPEALEPMLDTNSLPADYEQSYLRHMTLGRRVLALAYRNLGNNTHANVTKWKSSRDNVEKNLIFAGLLIMDSPLKADSSRVVKELRAGDQNVVMVTGDAVLTAAEVARRVGIVDASQESTYELCHIEEGSGGRFVFLPLDHSIGAKAKECNELEYTPLNFPRLEELARNGKANFCVTGDVLTKLAIHAVESANPNKNSSSSSSVAIDDRAVLNHPAAKQALSRLAPLISVFARHAPRHKEAVISAFNDSGHHTLMCGDGTNDVGALKRAHVGVSIVSVPDLEAKQREASDVISAVKAEEKKERKAAKKNKTAKGGGSSGSKGNGRKPKQSRAERIERSLQALAEAEDELNFVSLGNASVASPFTSRKTSVRCCKDILQQGRCTLVTMIQIYKILGVQCLVNALVLTTLHQKGVKQGDRQLTAVGLVVAALFLFVTRGKPLPKLSVQQPPSSVLCFETLLSMTVQFGIHFGAIMSVTYISDAYVDPYDPSIVPDGPFHPNTLNTATFLITVLATINAFLVNYRGRPYMESLTENKLLFRSIQGCYSVLFICALEVFPPLNQLMQLSPLPTSGPPVFGEDNGSDDSIIHELLIGAVDSFGFRTMLCAIMLVDSALVTSAEKTIRSLLKS